MYIDLIDKILISENCVRMFGKKNYNVYLLQKQI